MNQVKVLVGVASRLGTTQSTVWKTLNSEGYYPFHIQKVQALRRPQDLNSRIVYCTWLQNMLLNDADFFT